MNIELTEDQLEMLSLYLKRLGHTDIAQCAQDEAETYAMKDALFQLEKELEYHGFSHR